MINNSKHYKKLEDALERYFGDEIINYLKKDEEIIEIMANPDGSLFIEKMGQPMQRVGTVKAHNIKAIINTLASYHEMVIDQDQTILECEVPFCGSRFLGKIPPSVSSPSFTIRKKATKIFTLTDYATEKIITQEQKEQIEKSVKNKKNILIVGGKLSHLHSYHFQKNSTQYRIAYDVLEDEMIVFHYMVATRENFYKKLGKRV